MNQRELQTYPPVIVMVLVMPAFTTAAKHRSVAKRGSKAMRGSVAKRRSAKDKTYIGSPSSMRMLLWYN